MDYIIEDGFHFDIKNGKSPSYLINKYRTGHVIGNVYLLNKYEAFYLYLKNKISIDDEFFNGNIKFYMAYENLIGSGLYVKILNDCFMCRKSRNSRYKKVRFMPDDILLSFKDLYSDDSNIYITVDEEYESVYYSMERIDIKGSRKDDFSAASIDVSSGAYFGMNCPEWFGIDFHGKRLLNDYEIRFLNNDVKSNVDVIYKDLIKRGFIVKSGFKYGSNFRIYKNSMNEHSDYLVNYMDHDLWYVIARAVRLASNVRKRLIISGIIDNDPVYIKIERIKDIKTIL
ncbi:tRNA-intron lyase [Picrophilus oshimae]|uniref:tRNA-splicing endonuclease n=2 Tax=Picrophilus torridus (strain ATCC 700027 / DSM 9790 / JCM 10055 / NBRC 100828 / KAW 2/3) TaxID=1122961 RepID=ENDA_PICTO|nr:tRNA-intron lyase [Picrophilus oshimae]Q6L1P9.1 RecName: Full=tRNA-splicing endonuclease; AltName: Full=tRNA-intron endonuclease [Picrophilus oshimae DSM 9789]AAT43103.1 tRNA-intron endonuclease [Picrophilus oshimae DSM 9789]SMD30589.1 tRNA-intron endonuclease [Picrophilus oshimae DSM 9789]